MVNDDALLAKFAERIPLGRACEPHEVAAVSPVTDKDNGRGAERPMTRKQSFPKHCNSLRLRDNARHRFRPFDESILDELLDDGMAACPMAEPVTSSRRLGLLPRTLLPRYPGALLPGFRQAYRDRLLFALDLLAGSSAPERTRFTFFHRAANLLCRSFGVFSLLRFFSHSAGPQNTQSFPTRLPYLERLSSWTSDWNSVPN
jgi:hypothetical protein